ncbi:MAG: hypothetical protein IJS39_10755 [Synergistaceae bacterium]|nr:hypothetical protein [Synergistaceae bacterium]
MRGRNFVPRFLHTATVNNTGAYPAATRLDEFLRSIFAVSVYGYVYSCIP